MSQTETFSSRWGLLLASLGMAIGAGNLWRFPRLAGQYGGTFLLLWIVFLLVWSIPILLAEFSIGKAHKQGVIGSFSRTAGKSYTWMGVFITLCTLGITFYYSVVTAWGLRYLGFSLGEIATQWSGEPDLASRLAADPAYLDTYWQQLSHGNGLTIGLHIAAVILGAVFLIRGIQKGLEMANKILIPSLFVLLLLISGMALSMEGGIRGLEYMFTIDPALFGNATVWIEALSQSAWSTGAGWGLMMTLSAYSRKGEDVSLNIFISGFGNNTASLLAAFAILPAVFALAGSETEAIGYLQEGNMALTFSVIPRLFAQLPGGAYLAVIFFAAFFLAAFSSMLALVELLIRNLEDMGISRASAAIRAAIFCIVFGLPSAWSLEFFNNQDWVWGVGLVISGLFIVFTVLRLGAKDFKARLIDGDSDFRVKDWYFVGAMSLNLVLGIVLIVWWLSQGYSEYPWFNEAGNWNFFDQYSNATVLTQWGVVLLAAILLNRWFYRKFVEK